MLVVLSAVWGASCIAATPDVGGLADRPQSEERLSFQAEDPYRPRVHLNADVAMVYGIDKTMLQRIKSDQDIDYVILDKIDRFARNRRDDANTLFEIRLAGAELISCKENIDETPTGGYYMKTDGGKRYGPGGWPTTDPKVFDKNGAVAQSDGYAPNEKPPDYPNTNPG